MNYHDFNFAQPLWLWGLLLVPIGWVWYQFWRKKNQKSMPHLNQFIDSNLLPHLLINAGSKTEHKGVGLLYAALVFCIILALANPRWSFHELDAFQPSASMVVLMDLSSSMSATDVTPSRIIRARQNVEDLINLSKGLKIGLIGFAGNSHLISPITDDLQTIKNYIPALDTTLTNIQGNSLHAAFHQAMELLENEPGDKKSILLVSDGNFVSTDFSKELSVLTSKNIQIHVMGVGTTTGAPYKDKNGSLHKSQGKIVIAKLNSALLQDIAKRGHGIYTEAKHNDIGLRMILNKAETSTKDNVVAGKVRQWDDRYYIFLIPAAAILLYLMRARVLLCVSIAILANGLLVNDANATSVKNAFINSEQQAQQQYADGNFSMAAENFKDPYRKGVALYRAGKYAEAEQQFLQADRKPIKTSALFNAGNAQMQQRKWRAAIKSYETVLALEPYNYPAQHNLEIAKKMLEDEDDDSNEDPSKNQCPNPKKSDQGESQESDEQDQNQQQENSDKQQNKDSKSDNNKAENSNAQDADAKNQSAKQNQAAQQNMDEQESDQAEQNQAQLSMSAEDEARMEQWLKRVDSDIRVFLKNKFYIEDVLNAQN
jgi:Ca-activated chloride channel family protein